MGKKKVSKSRTMSVPIGKDFRITNDPLNFILEYTTGSKNEDGELNWNVAGYYQSIAGAINGYVDRVSKRSTAQSLDELIKELEEIKLTIQVMSVDEKLKNEIREMVKLMEVE